MNIVILHCHFEKGGVTQVVENHVRYLEDCDQVQRVCLFSGPRVAGLSDRTRKAVELREIMDFDYDDLESSPSENIARASVVHADIERQLAGLEMGQHDTILHWHNHSLGKNTTAPLVAAVLAASGWAVLLQVHDFAEDNRPQNYRRLIDASGASSKGILDDYLYPSAGDGPGNLHYAALTQGDTDTLAATGSQAHLLFNSVTLPDGDLPDSEVAIRKVRSAFSLPDDAVWTVYPVRGIRRKNVGEWLLLTRLMPQGWYSGLTLEPTTPVEQSSYQRWKEVAKEIAPAAVFDAGHHDDVSFADHLSACDKVFSTSVAEGFGMTFLEPWLADCEVIARRLPTITVDFERSGVQLETFYESIPIPGTNDWVNQCKADVRASLAAAFEDIPEPFRPAVANLPDQLNAIDFAWLTPARQVEVLRRMATDVGYENEIRQQSSQLVGAIAAASNHHRVNHNKAVIASTYSIDQVGQRLMDVYQSVLQSGASRSIGDNSSTAFVVDLVNQARPFYPCRTEDLIND